jgi:mannose-6-phosphate isomerase-like protein (cupin superfamily)
MSCPKIASGAIPMYPGGPRVFTIAETRPGSVMGLLFVPAGHGLSPECTRDTHLLFYVVAGKMLVNMRLTDLGGKMARFGVNKGGTWEVPRNTTFSMVNGLSMDAHLVFWRDCVDAAAGAAGHGASNGSATMAAPRYAGLAGQSMPA